MVQPDLSADLLVGERIYMLMRRQGISQMQLARHLGIAQTAISKRLRGQRSWSVSDLQITAGVLGVTIADLVADAEETALSEPAARWADLFGAAPNYTGGVPVDEWLEAHRD